MKETWWHLAPPSWRRTEIGAIMPGSLLLCRSHVDVAWQPSDGMGQECQAKSEVSQPVPSCWNQQTLPSAEHHASDHVQCGVSIVQSSRQIKPQAAKPFTASVMEQHVQAAVFTPRSMQNQDASTTSSEDSPSHNSCLPRRKGSVTAYPSSQSASCRSNVRRGRTMPVNNISLNTRVKPAWSVFTSPGSFEQLYNERAYLNASLRGQGERSFELMRRLTILHEQMDSFLPSDERRRSRKKAALIKSKITEAAAQEKAISIRLCDINAELNIRERWMQVQHEIYEQRYCYWAMESPVTGYMASPTDLASVVSTPLDAASPVFFPVGYYPIYSPMQMMPCHEPEASPPEMWADNEMNETPIDALGNHGLRFCYDNPQSHARTADEASSELPGADIANKRGRRMSLPSLRCLWPGQQEN